jgi:hypothetical protein
METILSGVKSGKKVNVAPEINVPKSLKQKKLLEEQGEFKQTKNKLTPNQIASKKLDDNFIENEQRRNKKTKQFDKRIISVRESERIRNILEQSDHFRYLNMPVLAKVIEYRHEDKKFQQLLEDYNKGVNTEDPLNYFNYDFAKEFIIQAIIKATTKKGDTAEHKLSVRNNITDLQMANMTAEFIRYGRFLTLFYRQVGEEKNEFRQKGYIMAKTADTVEADIVF